MPSLANRLAKDSLIYGAGTAFGKLVTLITAPILTRIFSPSDYGIITLIQISIGLFFTFAGMNVGSGLSYYYFHFDDDIDRNKTINTGVFVIFFFSFSFALLFYSVAPYISEILQIRDGGRIDGHDLTSYIRIASLSLFFGILVTSFQVIVRLLHRPFWFLTIEVTKLTTILLSTIILVVFLDFGVKGVFWASVIGSMLGFLVAFYSISDKLALNFSYTILTLMLIYCLPQVPAVIINWLQSEFGRFFLNKNATLSELGLYSIAFSISSVLSLGITAFRLSYDPFSLSIMKHPNALIFYRQVYSIFSFGCLALAAAISCFSKPILMILTPYEYHQAHQLLPYLVIAGFYLGSNNILATPIWLSKRTIGTTYAQLFSCIFLITFSIILIPIYGAKGAAVGYLTSVLAQSLAYYWLGRRWYPIPFRFWSVQIFTFIVFSICIINSILTVNQGFLGSVLFAILFTVIISLILWSFAFNLSEKDKMIFYMKKALDGIQNHFRKSA